MPVVLKMCLSASRIARPHALFRYQARLRLIYRLRISGSRFHRERGKGFVATAQRRHSFALSPIACTASTFRFNLATLNLPDPDKATSKSAQVSCAPGFIFLQHKSCERLLGPAANARLKDHCCWKYARRPRSKLSRRFARKLREYFSSVRL